MLTPLQEMRAKYKARQKELGKRESDTLAKLTAFQAALRVAKAGAAPAATSKETAVYSGQVLEDDEGTGGNDDTWMAHKLKFKKHIDDAFRAGNDGLGDHRPASRAAAARRRGCRRPGRRGLTQRRSQPGHWRYRWRHKAE